MKNKLKKFLTQHGLFLVWSGVFVLFAAQFLPKNGLTANLDEVWFWSQKLAHQSFDRFYASDFKNTLPGYLYVLKVLGHLSSAFNLTNAMPLMRVLFKLPSLLSLGIIGPSQARVIKTCSSDYSIMNKN